MTTRNLAKAGDTQKPLWSPGEKLTTGCRLATFMRQAGQHGSYGDLWRWSIDNPEQFWFCVVDFCGVIGDMGNIALQYGAEMPEAQFFPDARLNYAENLLRRRDDHPAIIFRDETGRERALTFAQLHWQVSLWQQALQRADVGEGDRVAGYMPNLPETVIAMLAATSLGAVWSSASPDFGARGLLDRIGQIEPKVLIAVDGYYYGGKKIDCLQRLREVQPLVRGLQHTIIVPFVENEPELKGLKDTVTVSAFTAALTPKNIAFVRVAFNHPLFIMFSSGTTGPPKCIVHGHGGTLLQHLKELQLQCDVRRDDRVFYFTTCGWMMWNLLASALACEATLLLYDGNPLYPDADVLWEYTSKHKCTLFGTSAKYIDSLKGNALRPGETHDLSSLRTICATGSPLVHESFDYVYDAIKGDVHLASISGGTDIISSFVLGNPVSPVWRGEIQGAGLGMAVEVFDDHGEPMPGGAGPGELVCTRPFPTMPAGFWNDPEGGKYRAAYFERFPGVWCHGDWIERTVHGGFIIHGRSDATLNPGGVRIGTAEIYRQVEQVPDILESIAVGQDWQGDVRVILFVRLTEGAEFTPEMENTIKTRIRDGASPHHVPAKIIRVTDIPRTKNNKITELAVRDVIHGRTAKNIEALANPQALELYKNLPELQR